MREASNTISVISFDTVRFPFRQIFSEFLAEVLGCPAPERLHEFIPSEHRPRAAVSVAEDQKTYAHAVLYKLDPRFRPTGLDLDYRARDRGFVTTYVEFVRFLESEIFGERLVYQTLPTIRVQLPGNLSVGEFHRDRKYGHPVEEVNVWVPVTRSVGTATIQLEESEGAGNHQPAQLDYGQFIIFGSELEHGNLLNREGYSRVSFDFRVIPLSRYREPGGSSYNEHKRFVIGDYYSLLGG